MKAVIFLFVTMNSFSAYALSLISKAECTCKFNQLECTAKLVDTSDNELFVADNFTGSYSNSKTCDSVATKIKGYFAGTRFEWGVEIPAEFRVRMARLGKDREECSHRGEDKGILGTRISARCDLRLTYVLIGELQEGTSKQNSKRVVLSSDYGVFYTDTITYKKNGSFPNPMITSQFAILKMAPVIQYLENLMYTRK